MSELQSNACSTCRRQYLRDLGSLKHDQEHALKYLYLSVCTQAPGLTASATCFTVSGSSSPARDFAKFFVTRQSFISLAWCFASVQNYLTTVPSSTIFLIQPSRKTPNWAYSLSIWDFRNRTFSISSAYRWIWQGEGWALSGMLHSPEGGPLEKKLWSLLPYFYMLVPNGEWGLDVVVHNFVHDHRLYLRIDL